MKDPAPKPQSRLSRAAFLVGSTGLLAAMAIDALAVLGRHTGISLLGSIELVQTTVVLIATSAMISATLAGTHAAVHILTERLPARANRVLARFANFLSAIVFLLMVAGSSWIATDLWSGFEQTELLQIPLRWFRLLAIFAFALVAGLFLLAALRRTPDDA